MWWKRVTEYKIIEIVTSAGGIIKKASRCSLNEVIFVMHGLRFCTENVFIKSILLSVNIRLIKNDH